MKKIGIIIAVIVVLLLIGGGAYFYMAKKSPVMQQATSGAKPTSSSVFSSIQDALARSVSLQCDFTNSQGTHVVAYIKNGAIRSDITSSTNAKEDGSLIMKDKKMYFWNAQKTGFMMDMSTLQITPTPGSAQNTVADLEQYKKYCKGATVADSLFVLPTDIKFTDYSQMMHAMPSVKVPTTSASANPSTGNYAIPTQYQQYMQK